MPTIYTHSVVGLGLARLFARRPMPWAYWGLAAVLPIIPDLDAFSMAAYGSPSGHRGFTHSLAFALAVSTIAAGAACLCFRACKGDRPILPAEKLGPSSPFRSWWRLAGVFFIISASHGLLDALTRGGFAIPFFWPLPGRWGNWGPIPASTIGFELPDPFHQPAMRAEMLWIWLPLGLLVGLDTVWRCVRRQPKNDLQTEDD
jgi:inner membrane protein